MIEQAKSPQRLQVTLAVSGAFHHFDLARELEARGFLKAIYSTFPWTRLKREGVSREFVHIFPWIHTPLVVLGSRFKLPDNLGRSLSGMVPRTLDAWVARTMPDCDVYIAISGSGVSSGRRAQSRGVKYVCDRGSSHIRYQDKILREEFERWGAHRIVCDPRIFAREEAEYEQADAITVPSEFARRSFVEMGVQAEKLHRIPYGVRLDRFLPVSQPAIDHFDILFVGQVGLRKGVPYLLQAFRQLNHPHKRLRFVGAVQPELANLLPQLPTEGVEFLGSLPQDKLPAIMSSSHVMVLPSIEEGLALVQAQSMACGCPLISSYNTGGEDLFTDGVEGFLVPIRSPEAIAIRLQELADDPQLQQYMSRAHLNVSIKWEDGMNMERLGLNF
ncbi:glycosyltransferase [Alloacidobacterium sp.]|uniref:glycosyltransferase n=1 Tax=Alloacidobacterium sp. TaxID=2951999 RepID=UPI002D4C6333|nr:glycosyltransferase [Alloacidobacterium sp.]HYK36356.1 glycosyltransferase [Alloacidobacterium sp.]